jgi:hypothetical protein
MSKKMNWKKKKSIIKITFSNLTVKSTTETSGVGTLKAIPVILPLRLGITFPTAIYMLEMHENK